jgi:hypothetical protein
MNDTIWVTDAELIRRSGVPEKVMRANLRALDANPLSGFPKKDPLWGGRRHWPSVQKYWVERANKHQEPPPRRMFIRSIGNGKVMRT